MGNWIIGRANWGTPFVCSWEFPNGKSHSLHMHRLCNWKIWNKESFPLPHKVRNLVCPWYAGLLAGLPFVQGIPSEMEVTGNNPVGAPIAPFPFFPVSNHSISWESSKGGNQTAIISDSFSTEMLWTRLYRQLKSIPCTSLVGAILLFCVLVLHSCHRCPVRYCFWTALGLYVLSKLLHSCFYWIIQIRFGILQMLECSA